jgi:hypothetical protein
MLNATRSSVTVCGSWAAYHDADQLLVTFGLFNSKLLVLQYEKG